MANFIKLILKHLGALILATGVFIFLFFVTLSIITAGLEPDPIQVENDTLLVLDMNIGLSDAPRAQNEFDVFADAVQGNDFPVVSLRDVLLALEEAETDDRINGILLKGNLVAGSGLSSWGTVDELRRALITFRERSGKSVTAYMEVALLRDYFLATAADEIVLKPYGVVELSGLSAQRLYFAEAFERYGIGIQSAVAGDFKSAIEGFTRRDMSPADREQTEALLGDLWETIIATVGEARGLTVDELQTLADETVYFEGQEAIDAGLADSVSYLDAFISDLANTASWDPELESFRQIGLNSYLSERLSDRFFLDLPSDTVAVVYAQGPIAGGPADWDSVGADGLAEQLRELRAEDAVDAVVVRVNSPGGSAYASEVIRRELELLQNEKPVIISMGGVAASGGYWIATSADRIFAEPLTITGSIGVVGMIPNVEQLASDWGVNYDSVVTAPTADAGSLFRPLTDHELGLMERYIMSTYDDFIERVANARDMSPEDVLALAGGRVYTGNQALELDLIDELGGLEDAVEFAATRAGLSTDYTVIDYPQIEPLNPIIQGFLQDMEQDSPVVQSPAFQMRLRLQQLISELELYNDPRGAYMMMPYQLEIR